MVLLNRYNLSVNYVIFQILRVEKIKNGKFL